MVTNIAPDHLDFYGTLDAIYDSFEDFVRSATETVVLCADDEGTRHLATRLSDDVATLRALARGASLEFLADLMPSMQPE
jgi:UDP-N-acetylmuramate-alanine ligase